MFAPILPTITPPTVTERLLTSSFVTFIPGDKMTGASSKEKERNYIYFKFYVLYRSCIQNDHLSRIKFEKKPTDSRVDQLT